VRKRGVMKTRYLFYVYILILAGVLPALGATGVIKGCIFTPYCGDNPSDSGEVYLYDADTTLIDSTCIGAIVYEEYRFEGLSAGTYYVQLKVAKDAGCPESVNPDWWYEKDTKYEIKLRTDDSTGGVNIYPVTRSFISTGCPW